MRRESPHRAAPCELVSPRLIRCRTNPSAGFADQLRDVAECVLRSQKPVDGVDEGLHADFQRGLPKVLLGLKVILHEALGDPGRASDVSHRRAAVTAFGKSGDRRVQNRLARPNRV